MGLFSKTPKAPPRTVSTLTGNPQPIPEGLGTLERRGRLFVACMRELSSAPVATEQFRPLGDGSGMEELVDRIRPIVRQDRSILPWVALRGALPFLYASTKEGDGSTYVLEVEPRMALTREPDPDSGDLRVMVAEPWRSEMTRSQRDACTGLACSIGIKLEEYPRFSRMNMGQVFADPMLYVNEAMALDYIVWAASAMLRVGATQCFGVPEPDLLEGPGWYTDPLWAKGDRWWDGHDWTDKMQIWEGRRPIEISQPLWE